MRYQPDIGIKIFGKVERLPNLSAPFRRDNLVWNGIHRQRDGHDNLAYLNNKNPKPTTARRTITATAARLPNLRPTANGIATTITLTTRLNTSFQDASDPEKTRMAPIGTTLSANSTSRSVRPLELAKIIERPLVQRYLIKTAPSHPELPRYAQARAQGTVSGGSWRTFGGNWISPNAAAFEMACARFQRTATPIAMAIRSSGIRKRALLLAGAVSSRR